MIDSSPIKRLLVLASTAAGGIAVVVTGALLLGNHFADSRAVAAPAPTEPAAPTAPVMPPAAVALEGRFSGNVRPLLAKYCADCHLNGKSKGDIALDKFTTLAAVQSDAATWRRVSDAVGQKTMPPKKRELQPTDDERKQMVAWVKEGLDWCDCSGPRDPGRVVIHRLNRNEYNNTVRDLLGVEDLKLAADFPHDDAGYGFDNIADVLTMSPLLAEKYLAAAESAIDKAVPAADAAKSKTVTIVASQFKGSREFAPGDRGSLNLYSNGELSRGIDFPAAGRYEIRVTSGADQAGTELAKLRVKLDGRDLQTFDVPNEVGSPGIFKLQTQVDGGKHKLTTAFINDFYDGGNPDPKKRDRNLTIFSAEIEGPFDAAVPAPPASQKTLLFAKPGADGTEEQCAAKILERFATRAYRRPVSQEEVAKLVALFKVARQNEGNFEKGMKIPMAAVLVTPAFLFRIENDQPGDKAYAIADMELATRLSYFLWSSVADDELTAQAASGKLRDPQLLSAQIRRMLASPKADALVTNFTGQWLQLRNLDDHTVDRKLFKGFNDELRRDMKKEVELFFANLIREDRSILDLVSADYTFINERLAKQYGINDVKGNDFRRVTLAKETHRGGVLTMGGVLTVTAMPTRTSPVKRGKYILGQFLGMEPPPPPANVPSLSDKPQDATHGTLRQRLEQHREDPTCFSCHARMDPIGFAMESFDAVGKWRDKDGAFALDTVGTFPSGETFNGPDELRNVLLQYKQDFVKTLTEKMLMYALGRGLEPGDRCTVKDICAAVEKSGYKFSALVDAIVASDAFQKKRPG